MNKAEKQRCPEELLSALDGIRETLAAIPDEFPGNEKSFDQLNAYLSAHGRLLEVLEVAGASADAKRLRSDLCERMSGSMARPARKIPRGERRALVASVLYQNNYRLPLFDGKGDRMLAAMLAADLFIDTNDEVAHDDDAKTWIATFIWNYGKLVSSTDLTDEDARERAHNKVRKSIARFKKHIDDEPLYRFNPDSLQFEKVSFVEAAHGLARGPGRPKSSGS
ncbi:hypothetical protein SOQ14_00615 [Erythrobacter sp. T5W1-R]|uniref:hypothetical protein n=1 Tax=Erythrobacter sp. T5W1-R TaxID=3101752 RepID=UPI002B000ECA|nr:hypothetical protein [Erythrobacter sp. T5W1-R]MEA1617414.1 hypothetical protein [Erythrobacter sp. T5W1-R]